MGSALLEGRLDRPSLDEAPHQVAGPAARPSREILMRIKLPLGLRTMTQCTSSTGGPIQDDVAVPLMTSSSHCQPLYHRTRTYCQIVCASFGACLSCGKRSPFTCGRPLVPGSRGRAATYSTASSRSGAIKRLRWQAQAPPKSRTLYTWASMRLSSTARIQWGINKII